MADSTCPLGPEVERLYRAAIAADAVFQAALVAQFGIKQAGDMRYMTSRHNQETCLAGDAKRLADDSYLAAVRRARRMAAEGITEQDIAETRFPRQGDS